MDFNRTTIAELKKSLQKRELSCEELMNAVLDRIEAHEELNAYITVEKRDSLIQQARECDAIYRQGGATDKPLLGIPVAIKDMISVKGMPMTCGSKILSNYIPPYDASAVVKLKAAGAIIIGKNNMDEFAMGSSNENSYFGVVRNPWDLSRVPGGSSGGSAATVAARDVLLSYGTDTGGSVRQPASLCGIFGIKPTYGRISRYGVTAFASSLDQIGVFAVDVKDLALGLKVVSGYDPNDATSLREPVPDFTDLKEEEVRGVKIGMPKEFFGEGLDAEVKEKVLSAIKDFQNLGAEVVEISLPSVKLGVSVYYVIAPAEASSNLARYDGIRYGYRPTEFKDLYDLYCKARGEGFGAEVKRRILVGTYVLSQGYYDAYYTRAQKVRRIIKEDFERAFKECDIIVGPTSPVTAFKIGEKSNDPLALYLCDVYTVPVSLAGLPGLNVPCGFDRQGLPIGLQLIGRHLDERRLLGAAYLYSLHRDFHKQLPNICKGS